MSARDCLARREVVSQVGQTRGARGATLETLGCEYVVKLDGGFGAWKEAGLPTDEHHSDI